LYEFIIYRIIIKTIFSKRKQKIAYKGKFAGDLTNFILVRDFFHVDACTKCSCIFLSGNIWFFYMNWLFFIILRIKT